MTSEALIQAVLTDIREHGPTYYRSIHDRTDVWYGTIGKAIQELLDRGTIEAHRGRDDKRWVWDPDLSDGPTDKQIMALTA